MKPFTPSGVEGRIAHRPSPAARPSLDSARDERGAARFGAFLTLALTLGPGCSVLFDPAKAVAKACPASPAACAVVANATAACEAEACRYSCESGFVDANGDLDAAQGDGCELSCSTGTRPQNPAALTARVGARPGEIEWSFPAATPAPARYQLCTALTGAPEVCAPVALASCAGTCQLTTTGHPDNLRVTGKVLSVDLCGREGSLASAPTASATSLDTTQATGWVVEKSCPASTFTAVGGQLAIENLAAGCTTSVVAGDELWGDFTLDADLRYSGLVGDNFLGGLVFHVNGTGHRMSALATPNTSTANELSFLTQRKMTMEKVVAASIVGGAPGSLTHLRVTSQGGVISVSLGPDGSRLVEALRWSDAESHTGKLGIGAVGAGRAELTNFRVTTPGTLPPRGPVSVFIDFADGGFPLTTRPRLPMATRVVPCPALPPGVRCDGGCVPAPTSKCAHIERVGFSFPNVVVDLPAGIDAREPWSLSFRFAAAPDGGGAFPTPVNSTQGALLATNTWFTPTRGVGQDYGVVLEPGAWHDATWRFEPDAGRFAVSLDDAPVTLPGDRFPPAGWSHHLGAISFGEGIAADLFVTDVRISQP